MHPDARRSLLDSFGSGSPSPQAAEAGPLFRAPAFEELDDYRLIRTQRDFAETLGIDNPYYQEHTTGVGRHAQRGASRLINFACYDYLGLNSHPEVLAAAAEAAETWGISAGASRLTAGERPPHRALEADLAALYGHEAALAFVSGHGTNISVIAALTGPGDLVLHDAAAHNSIIVGATAGGATRRAYPHNDLDALERLLAQLRPTQRRTLIVTEGLFSMDGDSPDLRRLIEIKQRYGAWLMLDEAHALGVLGATGRGLAEAQGVATDGIDIIMGTLSKTLCACGGYVVGSAALIDLLRYRAPGMVYSVGLSPVLAAAARSALHIMLRQPQRVARLAALSHHFASAARAAGLDLGTASNAAVQPVIVGDSLTALVLGDRLAKRGILAVPIIPPGVPDNTARLRFFISHLHTETDIDQAIAATAEELNALPGESTTLAAVVSGLMQAKP
jgi:8-amino-7-oxononanoate synthase